VAARKITVTILPPDRRAIEVTLDEGASVADALRAGSVSLAKAQAVRIGGETVGLDTPVLDDQVLSIASDVTGG